jgi:hypothetical protein
VATEKKLLIANLVCAAVFITSFSCGLIAYFTKSHFLKGLSASLVVLGFIINFICMKLTKRLADEKRKRRTENGSPLG